MGLGRLHSFLQRHRRVALDTSIFIYQLEANARYFPLTDPIFSWMERRGSRAVTSTITVTELLVQPYRDSDQQCVNRLYAVVCTFPNLEWVAPDLNIAELAARLRAVHRLRTPDARQAATAIQTHATGLITNDAVFGRIQKLETMVLDRLFEEPVER